MSDLPSPLVAPLSVLLAQSPKSTLAIAFSGGEDSAALLHALSRLAQKTHWQGTLKAVHVHHGLSPHADAWAAFCEAFAATCGIACQIIRVQVLLQGKGIEAAARRARYEAFAALNADAVLLAHHREDQAETLLLNLFRGAGVLGVSGMKADQQNAFQTRLVRPWLQVPKEAICAYLKAHQLAFVQDDSNENCHFRRNFLRHELFPKLTRVFPQVTQKLCDAAAHFLEAQTLLDERAQADRSATLISCEHACLRFDLLALQHLSAPRLKNLLRFLCVEKGVLPPSAAWLGEAILQITNAHREAKTAFFHASLSFKIYQNTLYLQPEAKPNPAPPAEFLWQGESSLPWEGGRLRFVFQKSVGLSYDRLRENPCRITHRTANARLKLHPERPRQSLKNLFQSVQMPPWERARLPLFWCGETLVWVGNIGQNPDFLTMPHEKGVLITWEMS